MARDLYKVKPSRLSKLISFAIYQKVFRLDIGTVEELISDDQYRLLLDYYFEKVHIYETTIEI